VLAFQIHPPLKGSDRGGVKGTPQVGHVLQNQVVLWHEACSFVKGANILGNYPIFLDNPNRISENDFTEGNNMRIQPPFELCERPNDVRGGQSSNVSNWFIVPFVLARYRDCNGKKCLVWRYWGQGQYVGFMDTYRSVVARWRAA